MNVEIRTVAVQFLFLEYMFKFFGIHSMQCIEIKDLKMYDAGTFQLEPDLGQVARPVRDKLTRTQQFKSNIFKVNPPFSLSLHTFVSSKRPLQQIFKTFSI